MIHTYNMVTYFKYHTVAESNRLPRYTVHYFSKTWDLTFEILRDYFYNLKNQLNKICPNSISKNIQLNQIMIQNKTRNLAQTIWTFQTKVVIGNRRVVRNQKRVQNKKNCKIKNMRRKSPFHFQKWNRIFFWIFYLCNEMLFWKFWYSFSLKNIQKL